MKKLYSTLLLSILPALVFSQTRQDYEQVMNRMIKFCNEKQLDSLKRLGPFDYSWDSESLDYYMDLFGKIRSFKFMKIDSTDLDKHKRPYVYFAATSENDWYNSKTNAMGISLDNNNMISAVRFLYKSEHTDSMLKKYHYLTSN